MKIFLVLFGLYCAGHLYIFTFLLRAFGVGFWLVPALVWLAAMVFPWPRYFGGRMGKAGNILAAIRYAIEEDIINGDHAAQFDRMVMTIAGIAY